MLQQMFRNLKERAPLIHNITNYVTVNDVANLLLASGSSPIMADDSMEVEEITSLCSGLHLNIGTLNRRTVESMFLAGKRANELGHPVLLDPVGAGASKFRTETALRLRKEIKLAAIRGNISEIKAMAFGSGTTRGVDADVADAVTEENVEEAVRFVKGLARTSGTVIAMTGAIDLVAEEDRVFLIRNGDPMMPRITGSGCMLSALTTAYLAANPEERGWAVAAATVAMGLAGERAAEKTKAAKAGTGTFRSVLIDEIYNLDETTLVKDAKIEIR
ncbi:MAG TPA: hydroxyethylthiazole kinase [Opitutales bacterium]|nr:hydroxyethylthiazole kinase [Opitutales bacterium]